VAVPSDGVEIEMSRGPGGQVDGSPQTPELSQLDLSARLSPSAHQYLSPRVPTRC